MTLDDLSATEWGIISSLISEGDRAALEAIERHSLSGSALDVIDVALSLPELSWAMFAEHFEIDVPPALIPRQQVDSMIHALEYKWGNEVLKRTLDQANKDLEGGAPPSIVTERVMAELASLHFGGRSSYGFDDFMGSDELDNPIGIPCSFQPLNSLGVTTLAPGNVLVMAGDTGSFKTTSAVALTGALADVYILYFMKEQPAREVWHKYLAYNRIASYSELQYKMNRKHPEFIRTIRTAVGTSLSHIHVVPQQDFSTPYDVARILRSWVKKHPDKPTVWVLDYLTCLEFDRSENYNNGVAMGVRVLKNAALSTNSLGIVLCQLKDGWNRIAGTNYSKIFPKRSDIIWSSEVKNLATYILMTYHPATYFPQYPREALTYQLAKLRHAQLPSHRAGAVIDGESQQITAASVTNAVFDNLFKEFQP